MTPNVLLVLIAGVLFGTGTYLVLAPSISRALIGIILLSNGANVLFLVAAGPAGRAPIVGLNEEADMTDPLPQAMVLTAIVITLGMTAFILAMAHRSWQLSRSDIVEPDADDQRLVELAEQDDTSRPELARDADEVPR